MDQGGEGVVGIDQNKVGKEVAGSRRATNSVERERRARRAAMKALKHGATEVGWEREGTGGLGAQWKRR